MTIPRCSSRCVRKPRRWRSPRPFRRPVPTPSRCSAFPSSSRTISTSPACRPPPPAPPSPATPTRSAFVVERLEQAGAIVIGKTNLDQFATGLVGVRSPYGVPRNALRADLIPGGSSSGSATAVGAGLVPFSLGTDTAGSGRVPAALNGIVGLKPTLGALSMTGVAPACRTLDTVSIFALDVADAFCAFRIAAGYDGADPWSRALAAPALSAAPRHFRVGVPPAGQRKFFGDAEAQAAYRARHRRARSAWRRDRRIRHRAVLRCRATALRGPLGRRALRGDHAADRSRSRRASSGDARDHRRRPQA